MIDNLWEITPYIAVFGPIAAVIAVFDFLLHDRHKAKVFDFIVSLAQVGRHPVSLAFYGLTVLASLAFTFAIISINGALEAIASDSRSTIGFRSSGPILLAVFLKIVIWDYLVGLKSFAVIRGLQVIWMRIPQYMKLRRLRFGISASLLVLVDLFITAVMTGAFLNWWEIFQSGQLAAGEQIHWAPKPVVSFFDELNFMVKESIEKSFYVLNGSLFMYAVLALAAMAEGVVTHLNVDSIKNHIFRIFSASSVFLVLIVAATRLWVG